MTGSDSDMTAALTQALRRHAEKAPSPDGLAERAKARATQRRRRRVNLSIAVIVVLAAAIPVAVVATIGRDNNTPATGSEVDPTWRWESYRGVQVQVPPNWEYGVPGRAWCAGRPEGETRGIRPGAVGRPAATEAIGCPSEYPPVNQRENWLTFDSRHQEGTRSFDGGWVEETHQVNGVFITVFSDDEALRNAIFSSAQPIVGVDRHGCPSDHPAVDDPATHRPDPSGGGLGPGDTVESVSVCRYSIGDSSVSGSAPPLLSSSRITGEDAERLVDAILAAPAGEGPDEQSPQPGNNGSEIIILQIEAREGTREVVVRYSGRSGNGFDDGATKHKLTAEAIRPLLTGANNPTQLYLPVARLLRN